MFESMGQQNSHTANGCICVDPTRLHALRAEPSSLKHIAVILFGFVALLLPSAPAYSQDISHLWNISFAANEFPCIFQGDIAFTQVGNPGTLSSTGSGNLLPGGDPSCPSFSASVHRARSVERHSR